jgi:starch synthase
MSAKKRILFIANEMSPYLELTEFSEIVNKLAIKANDNNFEVRCIMPRFGTINERRHRLHEVTKIFPCRSRLLLYQMHGYKFIF